MKLRVPTHEEGTSIFWEFATDSYDLGFGLFFEWNLTPQENITITISESSDEEEEEEEEEDGDGNAVESTSKPRNTSKTTGQKTFTGYLCLVSIAYVAPCIIFYQCGRRARRSVGMKNHSYRQDDGRTRED